MPHPGVKVHKCMEVPLQQEAIMKGAHREFTLGGGQEQDGHPGDRCSDSE